MTTNHSSGRRHRGRRGRRSGNRNNAQQQPQPQAQVEVREDQQEHEPESAIVVAEAVTEAPAAEPPARPGGQRGRTEQRQAPSRPPRRRSQQRATFGPMPTEVLKRGLTVGAPRFPLQLRPVTGLVGAEGGNYGCPMLNRNATALPLTGNQQPPRCSLGWALHDEDEARLCMYTPDLTQCWKAHPEHIETLRERMEADEGAAAAD